nr:Gfo/Idh/MocA family oxidoreductase [Saprospiraceae bacterium]
MKRRTFIAHTATMAALGSVTQAMGTTGLSLFSSKVKCGFIGVGARGLGTLSLALLRKDVIVTAICDIDPITTEKAVKMVTDAGQAKPILFTAGDQDYKKLLDHKDVDVVFICTPWEWHTPMSVDAMLAGKTVACGVAGAMRVGEWWQKGRTYEKTLTPFMIMENVCYRRDVM